jgi:hypothetical protein
MNKLLVLGMLFSWEAFAMNNCKLISEKQATKAFKLIQKSDIHEYLVIDQYCEACLDDYPQPIVVEKFAIKPNQGKYSVFIDDKAINLTYFYAGGENIAQAVGCETIAVSKYIE